MHSVAIFFGVLLLLYGSQSAAIATLIIGGLKPSDVPPEYSLGRWTPYVATALLLTLPFGLMAGGAALCWWGVGGG